MAIQKIINLPSLTTSFLFFGGFAVGFFVPEMLFSALGQIKGTLPEYMSSKLARVRGLMQKNEVWTLLGGAILVGLVFVFKKLLPLVVGMIIGFTLRMVLINVGFSKPNFFNYTGGLWNSTMG